MKIVPAADGPAIVACNTCRYTGDTRDKEGQRGGAQLVVALREAQARDPTLARVAVEEMPCLFACADSCTIHLRAPGKVGYVLGRFAPDADAARAILDYAVLYAASETGEVPFKQWPAGVKGHFITRTPPAGALVE